MFARVLSTPIDQADEYLFDVNKKDTRTMFTDVVVFLVDFGQILAYRGSFFTCCSIKYISAFALSSLVIGIPSILNKLGCRNTNIGRCISRLETYNEKNH